jgi:hypothetical protein
MIVKTRVRGIEAVQSFLRALPAGTVKVGLNAFGKYVLGDERHGLKHYEKYKYISPFRSYSSDPRKAAKQRGWIFAHLDEIGRDNRTRETAEAWRFRETNNGYGGTFENDAPGAKWLWKDGGQSRQNQAVGHRTVSEKIASNYLGGIQAAIAAVKAYLKNG